MYCKKIFCGLHTKFFLKSGNGGTESNELQITFIRLFGFGNSFNKIKCQACLLGGQAVEIAGSRISVIAMDGEQSAFGI